MRIQPLSPSELASIIGAIDRSEHVMMVQLASLYVSRAYRRQGAASQLLAEAVRIGRERGASELYVSATPSGSAVGFYLRNGFTPTDTPHPALFELEPEDIHMVRDVVRAGLKPAVEPT